MPDSTVDTLLIGGGVASVRCARALRRHGHTDAILIVGDELHPPYNRPPLSKEVMRDEVTFELVAAEPATWFERRGIELRTDTTVASLDTAGRRAMLADGTRIGYRRCLIATGAAPREPPIPGAQHALLLRTIDDALAIRTRAVEGARAVLVGGGFIGVEVAASLAARGMDVTVVELAPWLWSGQLGGELSDWAAAVLAGVGVSVRLAMAVTAIEPEAVRLGDERLAADLIIAGVGVTPRDGIAREAGLAVDDGILTDASQATGADGVWAAGDVARVDGSRVEHWHAAREGGERAAFAMLGLPVPPMRAPWVFSEFGGQQLDVVGVSNAADERVTIGDATSHSFAIGFVRDGVATGVGIVNGGLPVEDARRLVDERRPATELAMLADRHV
jgi:3-phenylpropionate/trans-cinnamate dioxygenase ferredoxin reductase component